MRMEHSAHTSLSLCSPEDDEVREVPRLALVCWDDGRHPVRLRVIQRRTVILHPAVGLLPVIVASISSNLYIKMISNIVVLPVIIRANTEYLQYYTHKN